MKKHYFAAKLLNQTQLVQLFLTTSVNKNNMFSKFNQNAKYRMRLKSYLMSVHGSRTIYRHIQPPTYINICTVFVLLTCLGYRNHDKKKCHKYDSSKTRMRKKAGGREKEVGGGTRRGGSRGNSQRPSCTHSDDEEDEGIPASYHTVSLQVSQDVSTTSILTLQSLSIFVELFIHLSIVL